MLKITFSPKGATELTDKYCRLVLTKDPTNWHRLVETSEGKLEYRMGTGKREEITPRTFRTLIRSIVQAAKAHQLENLVLDFSDLDFPSLLTQGENWLASTLLENIIMADYEFKTYKTKKETKKTLKEIIICGDFSSEVKTGFKRGQILGLGVNEAREIANTPACDMTPSRLAEVAIKLGKEAKFSVQVLGEKEIRKLKMGALLAVGQGTKVETKFIVAEYWGAGKSTGKNSDKNKSPIILIGKGVTFDSGGLNVKPSGFMHEMHMDMSGGAAVLAAIATVARLKLKKNVIALIPAAENAISDDAMRAGDIVTAMNGKTIEVLHTDAEGRMILADALTYSERYNPKVILDVATLTGASLVALGQHASAIMTKDGDLSKKLCELGEESGDLVWPLPLWDEYKSSLKSHRADISNIATNFSRYAGSIEGGAFLSFFAPKNVPWVHIDMAPRMESISSDKLAKGATGEPVRLLVKFVEES